MAKATERVVVVVEAFAVVRCRNYFRTVVVDSAETRDLAMAMTNRTVTSRHLVGVEVTAVALSSWELVVVVGLGVVVAAAGVAFDVGMTRARVVR